jgi:hypothetical protein
MTHAHYSHMNTHTHTHILAFAYICTVHPPEPVPAYPKEGWVHYNDEQMDLRDKVCMHVLLSVRMFMLVNVPLHIF